MDKKKLTVQCWGDAGVTFRSCKKKWYTINIPFSLVYITYLTGKFTKMSRIYLEMTLVTPKKNIPIHGEKGQVWRLVCYLKEMCNGLFISRGILDEKLGMRPSSQNLYPIFDQNLRFSLPHLWPDQKFDSLLMSVATVTVVLNINYEIMNMKK